MAIGFDEFSKSAKGGTEIIKYGLQERLPQELLSKFQIICDSDLHYILYGIENFNKNKKIIYWVHSDPHQNEEVLNSMKIKSNPLANGGWNMFHKIVFISYHQMENWIKRYNIPRNHCTVIKYAINPIKLQEKPKDKIILVHQSNPKRGLYLLVDIFEKLCEEYDNIELKVHSSWSIYMDPKHPFLKDCNICQKEYENSDLYQRLERHPKIHNVGYLPNEELKKSLASSHIFAYPNIMVETFCLSLLEAMSAGCLCVHPNYGCLPETASNWTMMYDYHENIDIHKERFYQHLKKAIQIINNKQTKYHLDKQKEYVDYLFNWKRRSDDWIKLLQSLENLPPIKIKKTSRLIY
jgi:glycosyltransferase involved in cell wall biosynthesis